MKAIAVNGSPRKKGNTATLLEHALNGAESKGADIEMVNLYGLNFKGCISCFECKKLGGKSYGKCAFKDELTPLLEKISEADVLIMGTPIYFSSETGAIRSFLERLLFQSLTYTPGYVSIFPGKIQAGLIYTMNVTEENMVTYHYDKSIAGTRGAISRNFGNCDLLICSDTYQFKDYSKYESSVWDAEAKLKRHKEIFPLDCKKAYEMGVKLTSDVANG
ncbi:flavodoxin family protein [Desulfovibrio gilichinskyi]|uniref:NADPH-dependent FMN reductase n=1 Tax=Desulfovibrio gilichinskyi TaxID=1519643 RepID=A0A1X7DGX1_9BACT|nr:flavodoxin family protein [Desulfovibrio gilichinskyi]SMF15250.1 NADPH-dependent FMN reductase [Desulfovibrio gilichinskyi]